MKKIFLSVIIFLPFACANTAGQSQQNSSAVNPEGKTIQTRFNTPEGFTRVQVKTGSFGEFLRKQELKPHGSKVHLYNGSIKEADVHEAVLKTDVGKRDLQQCADAVMRLRAEYLYSGKQYDRISFNFTNGFKASYKKWAEGYRIKVNGNQVSWHKGAETSYSYENFRKYLDVVFMYAGTLSLSKELKPKPIKDIMPGDVFIYGGSPGHAVIVMDVAVQPNGNRIFMIAQSYMPAQEIHVLKNENKQDLSPWYNADETKNVLTPEWTFTTGQLRCFAE